jgi:Spy/CpxP family protein refolding chaperone
MMTAENKGCQFGANKCAMMAGKFEKRDMPCPMEMAFNKTVKKVFKMKTELALTREQKFEIFEIKEDASDAVAAIKADIEKSVGELKTALSCDTQDFAAARTLINSLSAQNAKIGNIFVDGMEKVANVLTDEQKAKIKEITAAKKAAFAQAKADGKTSKDAKKAAKKKK